MFIYLNIVFTFLRVLGVELEMCLKETGSEDGGSVEPFQDKV